MFNYNYRSEKKILTPAEREGLPGSFIKLTDGVTHYELGGPQCGEFVVLVHGFSVPYYIWEPTYQALTQSGFCVLRYDLFGRGYSDRPAKPNDRDLFVRQLKELLDALAPSGPVNLAGLSMGGVITGDFTGRYPERVKKLVLVDPAGFPLSFSFAMRLVMKPRIGEFLFNLVGDLNLEKSMASDFYDNKYVDAFMEQYRPQMGYKGFRASLLSTLREGVLDDGIVIYQKLGQTDVPVLLFWGEKDSTVPFKYSRDLVVAVPQVEFNPVADVGHLPHYEKPEIVNPVLIEFLRR